MKSRKSADKTRRGGRIVGAAKTGGAKNHNSRDSKITRDHYTPQGEHPEDRISRDREYIHRLRSHLDDVYDSLERDLGIKEGENWLFDFVHNEGRELEFVDYLREYGIRYQDIVEASVTRNSI